MLKKIPLTLLIVVAAAATVVSCSSNTDIKKNQTASYSSSQSVGLYGTSKNADEGAFAFSADDNQARYNGLELAKFLHISWSQVLNDSKSIVYDKEKSATYFETDYISYKGVLKSNTNEDQTYENTSNTKNLYHDDSVLDIDNYSLAKSN